MHRELPSLLRMLYSWRLVVALTGVLATVATLVTSLILDESLVFGLAYVLVGVLGSMLSMCLCWRVNRNKLQPMGFRW